jgi:hypothetical protein
MLTVSMGIVGLIFLSAPQLFSETIYHWKDRNGVSCYSNTNIPGGAAELSIMFAAGPAMETLEGPAPEEAVEENMDETPVVEPPDDVSDSKASLLKSRIGQRRTSIQHIENLLKTDPNDSGLRNRLQQKKQYLQEDIIHLGLLER